MQNLHYHQRWKYKNTLLLIFSLIVFILVLQTEFAGRALEGISSLGLLGAFLVGIFYVSIFTVAPATAILLYMGGEHNILGVAVFAALGAVAGDYLIFRFLRDRIFAELSPLAARFGGSYVGSLLHTPHFSWLLPVLGVLAIATPVPDEVGVGILGLSSMKNWQFIALTFILHFLGILVLLSVIGFVIR